MYICVHIVRPALSAYIHMMEDSGYSTIINIIWK